MKGAEWLVALLLALCAVVLGFASAAESDSGIGFRNVRVWNRDRVRFIKASGREELVLTNRKRSLVIGFHDRVGWAHGNAGFGMVYRNKTWSVLGSEWNPQLDDIVFGFFLLDETENVQTHRDRWTAPEMRKALECGDRTKVLSYLFSKEGNEMAAFVATVGTALSKENVRDIPRFDRFSQEEQDAAIEEIKQECPAALGIQLDAPNEHMEMRF